MTKTEISIKVQECYSLESCVLAKLSASLPAGKSFCLYPEDTPLPSETRPHILESDITSTVLFLKRMDIGGLGRCDFIDRPGTAKQVEQVQGLSSP